ncbi:hypothetical protein Ddye_022370 [Dipteronia dyeriana]|uniref:Leucine-rich repeat-containing N-terminal plant-type domain-containing protein n=1 Tax=Dipteronia dyeriana TaxID=168575 RepID=A0AAD9WYV7_9ROSI|nr:hypothetical protein Ddye_022370 [Dipteronia dyeriana]
MGHSVPCFFSFVRFVSWLCFLHLSVSHFGFSMRPLCRDDERSALLQFKEIFLIGKRYCVHLSDYPKVESWKLEGGNSSVDCCLWDGVKCDEETGHVIKLDISSSCLSGTINSTTTLFYLVHLQWLSLAYNHFNYSEIPATINKLSRLSHLNLSHSHISGQIPPQLLDLPNLVSLDLSYNYVIKVPGNEPHYLELGESSLQNLVEKLTNLKVLNLDVVSIPSPIPHILTNLSSLTYLSLQHCGLQGEFPNKIFQLPNLSVLKLSSNRNLTGHLPEFERTSPLTVLAIGDCGFSGTIPSSLGNLTKLVHLDVSFSSFLGELPISIGNIGSLERLRLEGCNFLGQVSSSLGNLTQLTYLDISHNRNQFSGQNSSSLSWIAKHTKLSFLDLSDLNLIGEIPLWLMNLTQLTHLDMSQNLLTGPIPSWLMNINRISFLHLHSNQLTKHIPYEIRNLSLLVELDLSSNSLQGQIPRAIFELKNLQYLRLRSNNLCGIVEFDMFLSQLESLRVIILSSNNLSVFMNNTIPNNNSQKLLNIGLRSCNLSEFPNFLRNQDWLEVLDLSSNSIFDQIPGWFLNGTMPSLRYLNLSHNLFTGFEQHPIIFPPDLHTLDLRSNKLQGPLPIPSMSMSEYLVSNNQLTGQISPLICKSKHLYALDLSNNNFGGVLPKCLANFSDALSILALQSNKFHGSIPQGFMNGNNLKMIDLGNNQLQGRIPRSLVNCTKLEYLHLGNNQITDIFPSWLGTLRELKILILKFNRLHGVIKEPEENFEFPKLQVIDLSHNTFRGDLPTKHFQSWNAMKIVNGSHLSYMHDEFHPTMYYVQVASYEISDCYEISDYAYSMTIINKGMELYYGKISNMLTSIILSGNKFEGEIPTSLASLRGLNILNLSYNILEGHIPSCLGNLTALESLDFSNNRLSGNIPEQLAEITSLEVFDVSCNLLTGLIPHGKQFNTFENSSYDGNLGLCGKPLSKHCETSKPPSNKEDEEEDTESPFVFDWKIVLIGFTSGLIVGVILGQEFYQKKKNEWLVKIFGMQSLKRRRGCKN